MGRRRGGSAACLVGVLMALAVWPVHANADSTAITESDWQYRALDALAQAGLLSGHPKGPISEWAGDRLTRYEAASLTLRAVEGLGAAYQAQGKAFQQIAQAGPQAAPVTTAPVSGEDLARVQKLIEEFRGELVTMGARVDNLQTALKDVQSRLAKVEAEQKQHKIDGYLQLRFADDRANSGQKDFLVRNARISVRGPLGERTTYRIEMQFDSKESGKGPGSKAQLRTATIDYQATPASRVRMGQMTLPWGYELEWPTQELWSGERAFFMDRLFPDQRDLGLLLEYQRSPKTPKFDLGSFNGTGIDVTDNNKHQNVLARMDFALRNGSIALSGYSGANDQGSKLTRQDRDGVSLKYRWGDTQFLGEFVAGEDLGHDIRGWYGQLGHPVGKRTPNLLFAKYDQYDENRSAPDDLFRRWTLGYWYYLDKATRLTLAFEKRDADLGFKDYSSWNGNRCYLQLQVVF